MGGDVVAQVIEAKLGVGAVGDVGSISDFSLLEAVMILYQADRKA
jgi:hypothetical protein